MLLFALFVVIAATYLYWDTHRKMVRTLGVEGSPPKLAVLSVFKNRFAWARPFLWDIFRLIVVPYLFQLAFSKLFSFVF